MNKQFRLLLGRLSEKYPNYPKHVPWELVEPGREQALKNHYQTLERLNERGGLSPSELKACLEGTDFPSNITDQKIEEDMQWVLERLQESGYNNQETEHLKKILKEHLTIKVSEQIKCNGVLSSAKVAILFDGEVICETSIG